MRRCWLLILAVLLVALSACQTVPLTGRSQLLVLSQAEELNLGGQAWAQTLQTEAPRLITSGPEHEMVQRVGSRVAAACEELAPGISQSFDWEFVLINDPDVVNAWALPGGKSAVYTGLLAVTQDEDGLAAVVGHEVAHAVARHGNERMSQQTGVDIGMMIAGQALGDWEPLNRDLALGALGLGVSGLVVLPFSRSHESEADYMGLLFAAQAGYDPRAAPELWRRMAEMGGGGTIEFLSTHPSHETRIANLEGWMPEAMAIYERR